MTLKKRLVGSNIWLDAVTYTNAGMIQSYAK